MVEVQCKDDRSRTRQTSLSGRKQPNLPQHKEHRQDQTDENLPEETPKTPRNVIIYFFQSNTGNDIEVTNQPRLIRCRLTLSLYRTARPWWNCQAWYNLHNKFQKNFLSKTSLFHYLNPNQHHLPLVEVHIRQAPHPCHCHLDRSYCHQGGQGHISRQTLGGTTFSLIPSDVFFPVKADSNSHSNTIKKSLK